MPLDVVNDSIDPPFDRDWETGEWTQVITPYLQVAHRIVWFREECPKHRIENKITSANNSCLAECTIYDEQGNILANAHKVETKSDFGDYIEKAQTGALGRALSFIGYGTQFCGGDLDEGERLADSPVNPSVQSSRKPGAQSKPTNHAPSGNHVGGMPFPPKEPDKPVPNNKGEYTFKKGKYAGQSLESVDRDDLENWVTFMSSKGFTKGQDYKVALDYLNSTCEGDSIMSSINEINEMEEEMGYGPEPKFDPEEEIPV